MDKILKQAATELAEQTKLAARALDGTGLLHAEGARRMLIRVAGLAGYTVTEGTDGKAATASNQSGGKTKAEKTKGGRKSSLPPASV